MGTPDITVRFFLKGNAQVPNVVLVLFFKTLVLNFVYLQQNCLSIVMKKIVYSWKFDVHEFAVATCMHFDFENTDPNFYPLNHS